MRRVPVSEFVERPWRIHELTRDFRIQDVWAIEMPGAGPEDFPNVLSAIRSGAPMTRMSGLSGPLFATRWALGRVLGWDRREFEVGERVPSLRGRLPDDLLTAPIEQVPKGVPFRPVYLTTRECAREIANRTVHAVMHLGWVELSDGGCELQMAVLVKPNGLLGRAYMVAITPFRHLIVYPELGRAWQRAWEGSRSRVSL